MAEQTKEDFSIIQGGLSYRFERRFHLLREPPPDPAIRVWIGVVITFLPLVVLSAIQGVLLGKSVTLPLLMDLTVYGRFVLAMPMLVRAERTIDSRLAIAVQHFRTSGLIREGVRGDLEAAVGRLKRARDSVIPDLVLLAGSFVLAWVNARALGLPVSTWRVLVPGDVSSITMAGHWLDFVSQPLFNFLVFRWLWRILLWSLFLWRVSRIDLDLVPTHPDGAAGLGFLGALHGVFGAFLIPLSITVAARGAEWVQYGGGTLDSFRNAAIAFAVIALAFTLGPLFVFTPKLLAAKRRGLVEYGGLALDYTHRFDQKWLRGGRGADEPLLGSGDIQSLADMGNSFNVVNNMRFAPLSIPNAIPILSSIALPMVPFLATIIPLKEILKVLMQLVVR